MPNYNKLYTPEDSAVVFIDHQPQMTFAVASIDRATLINNVTMLARVAKEFEVLTSVETESFRADVSMTPRRLKAGRAARHHRASARDYWGKVHPQISAGVGQGLGVPVKTAAA
jgi:nicotinamidase-related amidase